ncbi:TPA: ATP synthase F0 subunit A [Candidatus Dependentiae bacterium]|nr:MAG: ATP synthase subunit a [candidate division TM6 bacterium GW2011_GWF2_36_131]KKQ03461.1 MAG: ATP synthase subunit a [candidate division TM6 bacterium GW2011_GWE2_36_25]KKQ20265.1 MAG: ATP synthase subunit a [candidate division TM6 bacterium GW2011_GWA2_36_9]HBR70805.1 ATP synthase F0 subunit A [Candidatus Dependentiae bacterium]HCU00190.1 ATP synthase F0 subunit A [Candidatus Dependentiae bacterium]
MQGLDIFQKEFWKPLEEFGITNPIWYINRSTIIHTWIILGIILLIIVAARLTIKKEKNVFGFLVISFVKSFKGLIIQSLGYFDFKHFAFIISLFTFILLCNLLSLVPWFEEPTSDLSTTLALGISSFTYVQAYSIKVNGFLGYLKGFFEPFFFLLPLNVIGLFATIVSISFRLFGNIFGGVVISKLYLHAISSSWLGEILGIITGVNILLILFFTLFAGCIQAFVFSMLSLTYLSLAIQKEE